MRKNGFTLVELLVTVAIIAVLAGLSLAAFGRVMEGSKRGKCLSNLRQIGMSLQNYANDNGGQFPLAFDWQKTWDKVLIDEGMVPKKVFICPADKTVRRVPGEIRSYAMNGYVADKIEGQEHSLNGYALKSTMPASEVILAADCGTIVTIIGGSDCSSVYWGPGCLFNHVTGANYVFLDLHAEWLADSNGHWYCVP